MIKVLLLCLIFISFSNNIKALKCYECSDFINQTVYEDCGGDQQALLIKAITDEDTLPKCDGTMGKNTECPEETKSCWQETITACGDRVLGTFRLFRAFLF